MNAVILCAGFATRMYPLTENFPKPLLTVADRPVLDYLIDQILTLPSIHTVHIVSNARFFGHFQSWYDERTGRPSFSGLTIHIHNDGAVDSDNRLGAAADLQLALRMIGKPDSVLVSGGDNIYRFDLKPLWDRFLRGHRHRIVALAETKRERLLKTGVLELAGDGRVLRLHEKPSRPPSTWICPPLYFFKPSAWQCLDRFLETPGSHDAPGHFIDYLCQREPVSAFCLNDTRLDIGSIDAYRDADLKMRRISD
jgi:glucose-1-phosphate thymidylyltransferase